MSHPLPGPPGRNLLLVVLEDYFHVGALSGIIAERQWYRFETRLELNAHRALALLDRYGAKATFFVSGWVAENLPRLVREVADEGHEVASTGWSHRSFRELTPITLREELARSRKALEAATGRQVLGYRVADGRLGPGDLWALDVLAEEGYAYDCSMAPLWGSFRDEPWRRFPHLHRRGAREIRELPISTCGPSGWRIPLGGNWLRQLPHPLMRRAVESCRRSHPSPLVMYFHAWELDADQPRINGASSLQRMRQYRNLRKMPRVLKHYLERYPFTSIAGWLGMDPAPAEAVSADGEDLLDLPAPAPEGGPRQAVSLVVPCFNEEAVLPYLSNTLQRVRQSLAGEYDLQVILVDDGSEDGTWASLCRVFGKRPGFTLVRHERNLGVTAAILTGICKAETEIVCSIDCDCSYDPHELARMIPLLEEDVAMVTASPYHAQGMVRNVPAWRLSLSRMASLLYRQVVSQKLCTYTSCFRVYRREAVLGLSLWERGFLGISEMAAKLDLEGGRIVEHPAVLEARMLGQSKMKVLRTIGGHLRLLCRLAALRWIHKDRALVDLRLGGAGPIKETSRTHGE